MDKRTWKGQDEGWDLAARRVERNNSEQKETKKINKNGKADAGKKLGFSSAEEFVPSSDIWGYPRQNHGIIAVGKGPRITKSITDSRLGSGRDSVLTEQPENPFKFLFPLIKLILTEDKHKMLGKKVYFS